MVDGLSTKQWFLIRTIMDMPADPPPTIIQIARDMDSTRQNISKMLEKMERDGFVAIEEDEYDRRSRRVRITESGLQHARQVAEDAQGFLSRLFEGISQDEIDTGGQVVIKMVQNLIHMQEKI